ncbi:MAG TPA: hypothetical protein VM164_09640 [Burkholderiales bacterium]|nr:hypothetical protein [Burkholderiales bacterium]
MHVQLGPPAGAFTQTADFGASQVTRHSRPLTFWLHELLLALMLLLLLVPVPELMLVLVLVLMLESVLTFDLVVLDTAAVSARPQAAQNRAITTIRTFIIGLLSRAAATLVPLGENGYWYFEV